MVERNAQIKGCRVTVTYLQLNITLPELLQDVQVPTAPTYVTALSLEFTSNSQESQIPIFHSTRTTQLEPNLTVLPPPATVTTSLQQISPAHNSGAQQVPLETRRQPKNPPDPQVRAARLRTRQLTPVTRAPGRETLSRQSEAYRGAPYSAERLGSSQVRLPRRPRRTIIPAKDKPLFASPWTRWVCHMARRRVDTVIVERKPKPGARNTAQWL